MNNQSFSKTIIKHLPSSLKKQLPKSVAVVSISDTKSRELNRTYRKKDKPTNVLSFRYDDTYGEILICPAVVRREAKAQRHTFHHQMTWMIVHGIIHLAGIHHERSAKMASRVERVEQQLLQRICRSSNAKFKNQNIK